VALSIAAPARAYAIDESAHARSGQAGVDVTITAEDEASHHAPSGHSASTCHWSAIEYYDENTAPQGERPGPEYHAYLVFCDNEMVGVYWLGPRNLGRPDPAAMAGEVVGHVPVDLATIGVRPAGRAVTGIPSYFWVNGYRGDAITDTVSAFGIDVGVAITLQSVVWDFHDGSPTQEGLGEPWPTRSTIKHSYRDKGVHTVTVTLTLSASFSVNGGPATPLPPIVRTATLEYPVDEVQAVRDR
jgi:hypothetical protein